MANSVSAGWMLNIKHPPVAQFEGESFVLLSQTTVTVVLQRAYHYTNTKETWTSRPGPQTLVFLICTFILLYVQCTVLKLEQMLIRINFDRAWTCMWRNLSNAITNELESLPLLWKKLKRTKMLTITSNFFEINCQDDGILETVNLLQHIFVKYCTH